MRDYRCPKCGGIGCLVCDPHWIYDRLTCILSDNQPASGVPYHLTYPYSYFVAPPGASYEEAIALCKAEMENRKK